MKSIITTLAAVGIVSAASSLAAYESIKPNYNGYKESIENYFLNSSQKGFQCILNHISHSKYSGKQSRLYEVGSVKYISQTKEALKFNVNLKFSEIQGEGLYSENIFTYINKNNYLVSFNYPSFVLKSMGNPNDSGTDVVFQNYLLANNFEKLKYILMSEFNEPNCPEEFIPTSMERRDLTGFEYKYNYHNLQVIDVKISFDVNEFTTMGLNYVGFYDKNSNNIYIPNLLKYENQNITQLNNNKDLISATMDN